MEFWETVSSELLVLGLGSVITLGVTALWRHRGKKKAAAKASSDAQWTFEQLRGDEWTLTRDSPFDAFSLHVWEFGSAEAAGNVRIAEGLSRGDLRSGDSVRVAGIVPGAEVLMDWVENAERLSAEVVAREGVRTMKIRRGDTSRYFGGL